MGTIPATSEPVEDIVDAEIVQPDDDDPILEGDDVVWEED
jgi:hypothetical protein